MVSRYIILTNTYNHHNIQESVVFLFCFVFCYLKYNDLLNRLLFPKYIYVIAPTQDLDLYYITPCHDPRYIIHLGNDFFYLS